VGRGLSELQRWILREAGKRRLLYHTDVLIHFFGWEPKSPARYDRHCEGGSWEEGRAAIGRQTVL
jgi:hypothetical protein